MHYPKGSRVIKATSDEDPNAKMDIYDMLMSNMIGIRQHYGGNIEVTIGYGNVKKIKGEK